MTEATKTPAPSTHTGRRDRPFLQPLAVALVSLILVSLALVTGIMDLRALDKTLTGHMEKQGMDIVRSIQQAAAHNFHLLGHPSPPHKEGSRPGLGEESFSLREAQMAGLMELAQRIDFEHKQGHLENPGIAAIAQRQGIWLIALLDEQGKVSYSNRPVPNRVLKSAGPVLRGKDWITTDLFAPFRHGPRIGFLGLRRKWGVGSIILALDPEGFLFWGARVSVAQAVEEVGFGTDPGYFVVTDPEGKTLFQAGQPEPLAGGEGNLSDSEEKRMMEVALPFHLNRDVAFTARLGMSRETADQLLEKEEQRAFVFTGFMVLIALLSMAFLYRNQVRHLTSMREMERRLNRAERLSAMGRLAAGVAHEIRNPLNAISMASQRLKKDNLKELTPIIRDEIRRLNHIVEEFIDFARCARPVLKPGDIGPLLRQMVLLIEEEAASHGITVQADLPESPLMIVMDADKIRQALFNILRNAMESIPGQGTVAIGAMRNGRHEVLIRISDTGTGLTPEETEQIFDPGHTTKEKGLGLGLALAHEIIQAHNGDIRVLSERAKGTTFEIVLPTGDA